MKYKNVIILAVAIISVAMNVFQDRIISEYERIAVDYAEAINKYREKCDSLFDKNYELQEEIITLKYKQQ